MGQAEDRYDYAPILRRVGRARHARHGARATATTRASSCGASATRSPSSSDTATSTAPAASERHQDEGHHAADRPGRCNSLAATRIRPRALEDVVGINYSAVRYDRHSRAPELEHLRPAKRPPALRSRGDLQDCTHHEVSCRTTRHQVRSYDVRRPPGETVRRCVLVERQEPRVDRRRVRLDRLRLHRRADALHMAVEELVLRRHRPRRLPQGQLLFLSEQVGHRRPDHGANRADGLDQLDGRPGGDRRGPTPTRQRRAVPQRHVAMGSKNDAAHHRGPSERSVPFATGRWWRGRPRAGRSSRWTP